MDEPDIRDAISDGNPENLLLAGTNDLLELASEDDVGQKEILLAELTVRWCLSRNAELGRELERILGETWKSIKGWRKTGWEPDKRTGKRGLPEDTSWKNRMLPGFDGRLRSRLTLLFDTAGFIPVYDKTGRQGAAFIPFEFTKEEDEVGAFWKDGERIEEWDEEVHKALKGTDKRGIRLQIGKIPVTESSLMLPVRMAAMRGAGLPLYDTLMVLATGKIVNGRLGDVAVKAKYDALTLLFADAILFGPDPDCDIQDTERFVRIDVNEDVDVSVIPEIRDMLLAHPKYVIKTQLDEQIEEYYAAFGEEVQNNLGKTIEELNKVIPRECRWQDVFTELYAEENNAGEQRNPESGSSPQSTEEEDDSAPREEFRRNRKLLEMLEEAAGQAGGGAIVTGEGGWGKTFCLQYYVWRFSRWTEPKSRPLCVFVAMGDGEAPLLVLEKKFPKWRDAAAAGRLRVVFDAVNESPKGEGNAVRDIAQFLKKFPRIPIVISSRNTQGWPKYEFLKQFRKFQICPMDQTLKETFLRRFGLFRGAESQIADFLVKIRKLPHDVTNNPMLLLFAATIYRKDIRLPQTRTGIYHAIADMYCERERKTKERVTRKDEELLEESDRGQVILPIDWRSVLGEFAFQCQKEGRMQGEIKQDEEMLRHLPFIRLIKAGNGRFMQFQHQDFRDYLCAEYLVAHSEAKDVLEEVCKWREEDYGRWAMTFAYAVELSELAKRALPFPFWRAAWLMNPWLGVALTSREWLEAHLNPNTWKIEGWKLVIDPKMIAVRAAMGECSQSFHDSPSWYTRDDIALKYVVENIQEAAENWERMEMGQLSRLKPLRRRKALLIAKTQPLLKPRVLFPKAYPKEWNAWLEEATPQTAAELEDAWIANYEDFKEKIPEWIEKASLHDACLMLEKGWAKKGDFQGKTENWVAVATPDMACRMIECGLVGAGDFAGRIDDWLQHPQFSFVHGFIEKHGTEEICRKAQARVEKWIGTATLRSAARLAEWGIREGWKVPEAFKSKIPQWFASAQEGERKELVVLDKDRADKLAKAICEVDEACAQIKKKQKNPENFAGRRAQWIENANIILLRKMMDAQLASVAECCVKTSEWYLEATPETAIALSKNQIPVWNSPHRIAAWTEQLSPDQANVPFIKRMLEKRGIAYSMKSRWLRDKSPSTLCRLVTIWKHMTWGEATELCALWGAEEIPFGKYRTPFRLVMDLFTKRGRLVKTDKSITIVLKGHVERVDENSATMTWNVDGWPMRGTVSPKNASWLPVLDMRKVVAEGQEIEVAVLSVSIEKDDSGAKEWWAIDFELGIKQFQKNPWNDLEVRCRAGLHIHGIVSSVADDRALVRFGEREELRGLIYKSEMGCEWVERADNVLKEGDEVDAVVLEVNKEGQFITLSCKKAHPEEWEKLAAHYSPGVLVRAEVVQTASQRSRYSPLEWIEYGVFVRFGEEGVAGLIHEDELGVDHGNQRKVWPRPGQKIEARVIEVDAEERHFALSVRAVQMTDNQLMEEYPQCAISLRYHSGQYVTGTIGEIYKTGAEVELKDGTTGFLSLCQNGERGGATGNSLLGARGEIRAIVKKIDWKNEIVELELRDPKRRQ